jgi:hypothetical protein
MSPQCAFARELEFVRGYGKSLTLQSHPSQGEFRILVFFEKVRRGTYRCHGERVDAGHLPEHVHEKLLGLLQQLASAFIAERAIVARCLILCVAPGAVAVFHPELLNPG